MVPKQDVTKSPGHLDHQEEKLKEISELAKTPGRVKEHADKWNKMTSAEKTMAFSSNNFMSHNQVVNAAQEVASSTSGSSGGANSRPVSRKDDGDTDSGSVQPLDPIRKKWMLAAALCEADEMADMLIEDPKLANFKDTTSVRKKDHFFDTFDTFIHFLSLDKSWKEIVDNL